MACSRHYHQKKLKNVLAIDKPLRRTVVKFSVAYSQALGLIALSTLSIGQWNPLLLSKSRAFIELIRKRRILALVE